MFAGGGSGTLAPSSSVIDAELMVAVDVAETGARGQASKRPDPAGERDRSELAARPLPRSHRRARRAGVERRQGARRAGRPDDVRRPRDRRARATSRAPAAPAAAAAELLARQAIAAGIEKFVDRDELAQWRARVALVARLANNPTLVAPDRRRARRGDRRARATARSRSPSCAAGNLIALLDAGLGEHRALVDRLAPTHLKLPRRGRVADPLRARPAAVDRVAHAGLLRPRARARRSAMARSRSCSTCSRRTSARSRSPPISPGSGSSTTPRSASS